jgi:hypothetical protein
MEGTATLSSYTNEQHSLWLIWMNLDTKMCLDTSILEISISGQREYYFPRKSTEMNSSFIPATEQLTRENFIKSFVQNIPKRLEHNVKRSTHDAIIIQNGI